MKCPKCKKMMYEEIFIDSCRVHISWKCALCGSIIDPTILVNKCIIRTNIGQVSEICDEHFYFPLSDGNFFICQKDDFPWESLLVFLELSKKEDYYFSRKKTKDVLCCDILIQKYDTGDRSFNLMKEIILYTEKMKVKWGDEKGKARMTKMVRELLKTS